MIHAICPFCGNLCDDISVEVVKGRITEVDNSCSYGRNKFLSIYEDRVAAPKIRQSDGGKKLADGFKEVSYDEAIDKAVGILKNADKPLIYGFGETSTEAMSIALKIGRKLRGYVDNCASICHGPSVMARQTVGMPGCTLGLVSKNADVVIYWGSNPVVSHPRHLARYSFYVRGSYRKKGREERKLIVIDTRRSESAHIADRFIKVGPGEDIELISMLRALVRDPDFKVDHHLFEDAKWLVENIKKAQFIAFFSGLGLASGKRGHRTVQSLTSLIVELNDVTKTVLMPMRGHYNVNGSCEAFTWVSGFPFGVDYSRGEPRYIPGETTSSGVIQDCDAVMVVASDPVAHFPNSWARRFKEIPVVVIDPKETMTTKFADVVIPPAIVGVEASGSAYRMDSVPMRLPKLVDSKFLPDEEILGLIYSKL